MVYEENMQCMGFKSGSFVVFKCNGFEIGHGVWRIQGYDMDIREEWLHRVWILMPIRVWKYNNGDVLWIDQGINSTPMYCLL